MKAGRSLTLALLTVLPFLAAAQQGQPPAAPAKIEAPVSGPPVMDEKTQPRMIGIDVGVYLPTNSTIHDVYGTGIKFGISPVTHIRSDKWHWDFDLGFISDNHDGAKLLIVPVNICYERAFGPADSASQPFARISGGLAYNDHTFNLNGVHFGTKTIGPDGALEVGTVLASRWRLSARYDIFTKSDGFDFSGFVLTVQYAAFKY